MKRFLYFLTAFLVGVPFACLSQSHTIRTYHDKEKQHLKEVYEVKDTIQYVLHGKYVSYYLNGKPESKGQFVDHATAGVWEFYYETGSLKMRGVLKENANFGMWEYFYENGQKSMEGLLNGRRREGLWKTYYENGQVKEIGAYEHDKRTGPWTTYYEDGIRKGEVDYDDDFGRYIEYYHSGKVMGEGPRMGVKKVGHWRYFSESGPLESEGEYADGVRIGEWKFYYSNGTLSAKGNYRSDEKQGQWEFYDEEGNLTTTGAYDSGQKSGYWKNVTSNGTLKSEITYENGSGNYREYYDNGKLKVTGQIKDDLREGPWKFYFSDGKLEGECEYVLGKGTYKGYYSNGSLQTKGDMEEDKKVGTWEIYEIDGTLSGYYRPFYDQKTLPPNLVAQTGSSSINKVVGRGKHFPYFVSRVNEFRGVIVGTNPVFMAVGSLPIGIEFYLQARLGHEFEFVGIRDPFFVADQDIAPGEKFVRGYSIAIKQKFYNPVKVGMWYFGHELRFTNLGHFANISLPQFPDNYFTASAAEQRIEYGPLLGYRLIRQPNPSGLTIDISVSYNIGYRGFDVDDNFASTFEDLEPSGFSQSFHFGLNFGNVFAY